MIAWQLARMMADWPWAMGQGPQVGRVTLALRCDTTTPARCMTRPTPAPATNVTPSQAVTPATLHATRCPCLSLSTPFPLLYTTA